MPDAAVDAAAGITQSDYTLPLMPKVRCDHGQLVIEADNATLMSVLSAVESCLGVQIKPPAGFRDERTFTHLGPDRADRVLADLLGTLDLNYAIVLSPGAGRKVTSVVLTSRMDDNAGDDTERSGPAGRGLLMTPARRLWLASQGTSGRPIASAEQAEEPGRDPDQQNETSAGRSVPDNPGQGAGIAAPPSEGTLSAVQSSATGTPAPATAKDDSSASTGQTQSAAIAGTTAAPPATSPTAPATPPASSDPTADAKATTNVLRQQIDQMQQMFEQRRKLNTPATPPASQDPQ